LSVQKVPNIKPSKPSKVVIAAVYFLYVAVLIRTLTNPNIRMRLPIYLALEFIYLLLFTLVLWRSPQRIIWRQLYFVVQSGLVFTLICLRPRFDFVAILNVLLSLQAALVFSDWVRWTWVGTIALFTCLPLMIGLGALQGLALALMPMTIAIIFAAYAAVIQEIEVGSRKRQTLLAELEEAHQNLTVSASQAEALSAIQERDRLARELHDSVSQTIFSISLVTRAAQLLLERDPQRLRPLLENLKGMTQSTLAEMRGLIAQMRPPEAGSTGRPTP
jgi:signal transduction histidine kinase